MQHKAFELELEPFRRLQLDAPQGLGPGKGARLAWPGTELKRARPWRSRVHGAAELKELLAGHEPLFLRFRSVAAYYLLVLVDRATLALSFRLLTVSYVALRRLRGQPPSGLPTPSGW